MNLLLDTNILLNIVRSTDYKGIMQFINPDQAIMYISVVSEAEIKSLSLKNRWGAKRLELLDNFLSEIDIVEVNQDSQRTNPGFTVYPFDKPRNMGKNDLWIASLAALLGLELVTTDANFDHLDGVFLPVRKINPNDFRVFA